MSRSRRKVPVTGVTTASSEKEDKKLAHRRLRRKENQALEAAEDLPDRRLIDNQDDHSKDGKVWHRQVDKKVLRK